MAEVFLNIGVKIITDIHEPWRAREVAKIVDIIQNEK